MAHAQHSVKHVCDAGSCLMLKQESDYFCLCYLGSQDQVSLCGWITSLHEKGNGAKRDPVLRNVVSMGPQRPIQFPEILVNNEITKYA